MCVCLRACVRVRACVCACVVYVFYPGKGGEAVQVLHKAEHLQADGGHDDEQAGREHH